MHMEIILTKICSLAFTCTDTHNWDSVMCTNDVQILHLFNLKGYLVSSSSFYLCSCCYYSSIHFPSCSSQSRGRAGVSPMTCWYGARSRVQCRNVTCLTQAGFHTYIMYHSLANISSSTLWQINKEALITYLFWVYPISWLDTCSPMLERVMFMVIIIMFSSPSKLDAADELLLH